jgi:hypothetical protein
VELQEYLVALSTDPDRMAEFIKDPDGAMERAGLSEKDKRQLAGTKITVVLKSFSHRGPFFYGLSDNRARYGDGVES